MGLEVRDMDLPKIERKKLINEKEMAKIAEKVKKSLKEEAEFLLERRRDNGAILSSRTLILS